MTGVLVKSENWDTDVYTGRTPCAGEGRDGNGGILQAKGCQKSTRH